MRERYFCVKVQEAICFGDISDGGEPKVWIDVEWGGVTHSTRKFKKPVVRQTLYFKIPIPPERRSPANKLEDYLN